MTLFLSRLTLNRSAGNAALAPLLDPANQAQALDAHHRLLWSVFADGPDRRRDFLWRADSDGRFFVLSQRPPAPTDLFMAPEVKEFAPTLAPGDALGFVLRVNATKDISDPAGGRAKSIRVDLVMDLLRDVPKGQRAEARMGLADQAAADWMGRQGAAHGFAITALQVEDYRAIPLLRGVVPRGQRATLGILDLSGKLTVTDPALFTARLAQGFGRARAFGCGLMLIRRG